MRLPTQAAPRAGCTPSEFAARPSGSDAARDDVRLVAKNFLTLDDVDFYLGKLTIFIGPQAEGKSLLAKLVDFFYDILSTAIFHEDYRSLKEGMQDRFVRTFPKRIWENDEFLIEFFLFHLFFDSCQQSPRPLKAGIRFFPATVSPAPCGALLFMRHTVQAGRCAAAAARTFRPRHPERREA